MPTRAVDELVRVEQNDPHHDRKHDDRHEPNFAGQAQVGLVSGIVLSGTVNPAPGGGIEPGVSAAADVLSFLPSPGIAALHATHAVRTTSPHMSHGEAPPARLTHEDDVVARAAAGDPEAFRTLFLGHKSDVARLVYRMLNAPGDLDDVVQEVFVQVFRSLKDFRGQAKFSTWLHRVTVNVVLMHRRSARSRPILTEEIPGELIGDEGQTLPDEDVERRERMRAFQRLLAKLADKKRIVFVLHELEGLSPSEIAEVVGAPVLTVRTRLFYARRELEAMLGEEPTLAGLAGSSKDRNDTEPCSEKVSER